MPDEIYEEPSQPEGVPFAGGIGGAISQQIMAGIQNMDVQSILQKIVATTPEDEESEEIRSKLQNVIARIDAMEPDEKDQFIAQMKSMLASKISMQMQNKFAGLDEEIGSAVLQKLILFGVGALLVVVLFGNIDL